MKSVDVDPAYWPAAQQADDQRTRTVRTIINRLLPFMVLLYFVNSVDRVNIAYAALTMNQDLGLTPEMYGFGAGIFFFGYFLFEIPSNLIMHRVGARLWMFRIMLTWGLISMAMAWVHSPLSFYVLRFLLGLAEAGFVPGMFLYLSYWVPPAYAGRANGLFILAIPLTTVLAGPVSVMVLGMNGLLGFAGWQWMFVIEGVPAVILALVTLWALPDRPAQVSWLTQQEKDWLHSQVTSQQEAPGTTGQALRHGLTSPLVLLMSGIYVALVIGIYGVAFWLPQIVRGIGFTNQQTGFVIAGPYLLGTIACAFWPRYSDRMQERRWHFALPCFLASVSLMASALIGPHMLALIPISLAVIGIWAVVPVFWSIPGGHMTGLTAAAGLAMINSVGNLGGFAGPYLVGWFREWSGSFTVALVLLGCGPLLAGVLALLLPTGLPATNERLASTRDVVDPMRRA